MIVLDITTHQLLYKYTQALHTINYITRLFALAHNESHCFLCAFFFFLAFSLTEQITH